jgi:hypothetical protein
MDKVIVNVDKTVVKISGLEVKGLNIQQLEKILNDKLGSLTRIIGVTGNSIDMDVYGIEEADILRDESGLIKAIAFAEGITINDLSQLQSVKKIKSVDIDKIPEMTECMGERWNRL